MNPSRHSLSFASAWAPPSLHFLYALISLCFGTVLALTTPPYATPDESQHVGRAVTLASGIVVESLPGERYPNFHEFYRGLETEIFESSIPLTAGRVLEVAGQPLNCELPKERTLYGASAYPPVPYLFSALVYRVTCASAGSMGMFFYLSRILNLIIATVITAFAIRIIPIGKWTLFVIALLPMTVFQSASFSADSITNAVAFFWAAILADLLTGEQRVSRQSQVLATVAALALAFCKPIYPVLLLPALLIPRSRFGGNGAWLRFIVLVVVIPIICAALWVKAVSGIIPTRPGIDVAANMARLLAHPFDFAAALARTLSDVGALSKQFLGMLGWLDVPLGKGVYVLLAMLLGASISLNPNVRLPRWTERIALLLVAIAGVILVAVPLYVTWTDAGSPNVQGIQGRYFIPLSMMALLAISFDGSRWSGWAGWRACYPIGAAVALGAAVVGIGDRYYFELPPADSAIARKYEGRMIRRASPAAGKEGGWFYVEGGRRRWVMDEGWMREKGIATEAVIAVPDAEFDAIAEYPRPLRSSAKAAGPAKKYDGKMVRRSSAASGKEAGWYLVSDGKRRWVTDGLWMSEHGFAPEDVLAISDEEFSAIPEDPEPLSSRTEMRR